MSAESNMLTPASRQMSTRRVASLTSVLPHSLKNSVLPPKVPVPKVRTGTFSPEPPRDRYSMRMLHGGGVRIRADKDKWIESASVEGRKPGRVFRIHVGLTLADVSATCSGADTHFFLNSSIEPSLSSV